MPKSKSSKRNSLSCKAYTVVKAKDGLFCVVEIEIDEGEIKRFNNSDFDNKMMTEMRLIKNIATYMKEVIR